MEERTGVFGIVDLTLPEGAPEPWLKSDVVIPEQWPEPLRTNTEYLPDADGVLPRETLVEASDLDEALARSGITRDDLAMHEVRGDGVVRLIVEGEIPHPTDVRGLFARIEERLRDGTEFARAELRPRACSMEAYFETYDDFCFAFDTWMVPLVRAASLGATGRGTFLFDDDCEEPVCFDVELAGGHVRVIDVDPQDASHRLMPRWGQRCEALRADLVAWKARRA